METMHVRQRSGADCGICCLAMATGYSYRHVLDTVGDLYRPNRGIDSMLDCLELLGLPWGDGGVCQELVRNSNMSSREFNNYAWGRRAILFIHPLREDGIGHFVYYDGEGVLDPIARREGYRMLEHVPSDTMILFRETPEPAQADLLLDPYQWEDLIYERDLVFRGRGQIRALFGVSDDESIAEYYPEGNSRHG